MVFDIDRDDDFLEPCLHVSWFNKPRHFQMRIHYATKIKPHEFIIYECASRSHIVMSHPNQEGEKKSNA